MTLTRAEISQYITTNPKAVVSYDQQQKAVANNTTAIALNLEATDSLNDATVLTLSANASFNNERVLELGDGLSYIDNGPGGSFLLLLTYLIVLQGGYRCTFDLLADTELTLPTSGTLLTTDYLSDGPYASDSAAAAGGVAVGGVYRKTGGTVVWRQV